MKRKTLFYVLTLVIAMIFLAACGDSSSDESSSSSDSNYAGSEEKTYTFKLGHEANEGHVKFATAEKFKEELEARSNGRMTVDIFPANQLGKEADMLQQLETGTLDFGIISNGTLSGSSEAMNGWFMPFLFDNLEDAAKARETESAKALLKDLENLNLVGFDVFFAGNRHVLSKNPVTSIDDLKGLKIRIPGAPAFEKFWTKIGAGPTPMPLPEVYTALQTGVIEGVDVDLDALLSQKYYETTKNLTLTNHITFPEVVVGSKQVFDSLSAEDQQIVIDAWKAAVDWGIQEAINLEKSRVDEIKALGVNVVELENTDAFMSIANEIYEEYSSNEAIKAFIEENKK